MKSEFQSCDYVSSLLAIKKYYSVWRSKSFFNDQQEFESLYQSTDGERLLSVVVELEIFLADKPLDFHDTTSA